MFVLKAAEMLRGLLTSGWTAEFLTVDGICAHDLELWSRVRSSFVLSLSKCHFPLLSQQRADISALAVMSDCR